MSLKFEDFRQHVDALVAAALAAAEPGDALRRHLRRDGRYLYAGDTKFDLDQGRVFVVSVGKAAAAMAAAAVDVLGDAYYAVEVIGKQGAPGLDNAILAGRPRVRLMVGSHPVSGQNSVESTAVILDQLGQTTDRDLVLCLISGGASALLTQPIVSLPDWQALVAALLASGCTINELNTVRRQLDRVKGGGLARAAAPARCVSLILSDVVGNPLQAIGSGPTILLSEAPADALAILARYDLAATLGEETYQRVNEALLQQEETEMAVPVPVPENNKTVIVGDVRQAAEAAVRRAEQLGFAARLLTVHLEGEAREVGRVAAAIAKDTPPESCLVLGGETTVTVQGDGLGGRNLELALSAAISLKDWPAVVVASVATDGEDGPTPAAGAAVCGRTVSCATELDLDPLQYLERNDSFHFFDGLDSATASAVAGDCTKLPSSLVMTGSTGTNVNDLLFILTYAGAQA